MVTRNLHRKWFPFDRVSRKSFFISHVAISHCFVCSTTTSRGEYYYTKCGKNGSPKKIIHLNAISELVMKHLCQNKKWLGSFCIHLPAENVQKKWTKNASACIRLNSLSLRNCVQYDTSILPSNEMWNLVWKALIWQFISQEFLEPCSILYAKSPISWHTQST